MVRHISEALSEEREEQNYHSVEFLPPQNAKGEERLWDIHLPRFMECNPLFVDFTWGAGGRSSDTTLRICKAFQEKYDVPANMHLTCTNMPSGLLREALDFCRQNGICNILALRGDPPKGEDWKASDEGFTCALDLVNFIRASYGDYFCITVAGYPEGHPTSIDPETGKVTAENMKKELDYLKSKVDAGADAVITQLFYDADIFIDFVKQCREHGIVVPIIPGILPISSHRSLTRMVNLCKTYVPPEIASIVEELKDNDEALKEFGISQAKGMVRKIQEADIGINHFHFYTVNAHDSTLKILDQVGFGAAKES